MSVSDSKICKSRDSWSRIARTRRTCRTSTSNSKHTKIINRIWKIYWICKADSKMVSSSSRLSLRIIWSIQASKKAQLTTIRTLRWCKARPQKSKKQTKICAKKFTERRSCWTKASSQASSMESYCKTNNQPLTSKSLCLISRTIIVWAVRILIWACRPMRQTGSHSLRPTSQYRMGSKRLTPNNRARIIRKWMTYSNLPRT